VGGLKFGSHVDWPSGKKKNLIMLACDNAKNDSIKKCCKINEKPKTKMHVQSIHVELGTYHFR